MLTLRGNTPIALRSSDRRQFVLPGGSHRTAYAARSLECSLLAKEGYEQRWREGFGNCAGRLSGMFIERNPPTQKSIHRWCCNKNMLKSCSETLRLPDGDFDWDCYQYGAGWAAFGTRDVERGTNDCRLAAVRRRAHMSTKCTQQPREQSLAGAQDHSQRLQVRV